MAKKLEQGDLGPTFTVREVYRKHWTGLDGKEDVEAATEILTDLGWVRPVQTDAPNTGRPTSQAFAVNPKIREGAGAVSAKSDKSPEAEVLALLAPPLTPNPSTPSASPLAVTTATVEAALDGDEQLPAELAGAKLI